MNYVRFGHTHFTNRFQQEYNEHAHGKIMDMYKNKYWGLVTKEQWQQNEKIVNGDIQGDLLGCYICEGKTFFIITIPDNRYTFFMTKSDMENGELERLKDTVGEKKRVKRW